MNISGRHVNASFLLAALALAPAAISPQRAAAATRGRQAVRNAFVYVVHYIDKSITAISYEHRNGATGIGFQGTALLPSAKGTATVNSKQGRLQIDAEFKDLVPAQTFGPEYLTYVLWAITPEGKASNLGEILLNGDKSKIQVTTPLQTFGLIVTAEPYYAVSQPSNVVVLENVALADTSGTIQQVTANYELLDRAVYTYDVAQENQSIATSKSKMPLELYEARNAVDIARHAGAEQYAGQALGKAETSLLNAEEFYKSHGDRKVLIQAARDAVQNAADATTITIRRIADDEAAAEKAADAARTAQAQSEATAAEARSKEDEAARKEAELRKGEAELQAQKDALARSQAELQAQRDAQARAQAEAQAQQDSQARAQAEAAQMKAQADAAHAIQEQQQLRAALLEQFNRILPTTDTPRGLKVNLGDVLFETGKYSLRPMAREGLARLSGIVIAHPGLKLQIEGYTDSVGSDAYNQTLSENRANAVRGYLVMQNLAADSITAEGFGKSNPVADNANVQGRQMNRRVEIIISGEVIGTQIGGTSSTDGTRSALPVTTQ